MDDSKLFSVEIKYSVKGGSNKSELMGMNERRAWMEEMAGSKREHLRKKEPQTFTSPKLNPMLWEPFWIVVFILFIFIMEVKLFRSTPNRSHISPLTPTTDI